MTRAKRTEKPEAAAEPAVPAKVPKLAEKLVSSGPLARPDMPNESESLGADAVEIMKKLIPWAPSPNLMHGKINPRGQHVVECLSAAP